MVPPSLSIKDIWNLVGYKKDSTNARKKELGRKSWAFPYCGQKEGREKAERTKHG